ncbi:hypothetical protein NQ318_000054 [Aromia moschata]|uniref:Biogenesis of lysosome-related organelles complex 1 subunit 1 n=1 Tax=Aromia moschata TaxID=1265417 RepID=A0AAV8YAB4_9CUCU|nr:hypothetical protein NQ318_000054 [Aromia moschata]
MGHVRKVPSKRQAVVDDDTKLNLLLALEENPITPARNAMLSSMVKDHQAAQSQKKEAQEERRREACAAAGEMTQALVDHLNVGVAQAYLNQKKLDAETKQLHASAANFSKQAQQWVQLVDSFGGALKELGDVENWSRTIEADVRTISAALEIVYKDAQGQSVDE